jgi:hypothetical protein
LRPSPKKRLRLLRLLLQRLHPKLRLPWQRQRRPLL